SFDRAALRTTRNRGRDHPDSARERHLTRLGSRVGGQQRAERPEVDVEIFDAQVVAAAQLRHRLVEPHERHPQRLYLLVAEVTLVDAAQGLSLHELPDQLDDGENELEQVAFHRIRIGLQPLREDARQSRCTHAEPPSCAARTELSSARNSSRTRSTPASEIVTSPASTTPVPSSRSSRSTKAICPGGTAGANAWVMAHPPRRRSRPATAL